MEVNNIATCLNSNWSVFIYHYLSEIVYNLSSLKLLLMIFLMQFKVLFLHQFSSHLLLINYLVDCIATYYLNAIILQFPYA